MMKVNKKLFEKSPNETKVCLRPRPLSSAKHLNEGKVFYLWIAERASASDYSFICDEDGYLWKWVELYNPEPKKWKDIKETFNA